ncbi:MAG: hypothetical protein ACRBFS_21650 [Aureispira sp.]
MPSQKAQITVHPPFEYNKLSRYDKHKGTFIIRDKKDRVLYIGFSKDLCNSIRRLFQNKGKLQQYDLRQVRYEVILTGLVTPCFKSILQRHFKPLHNARIQSVRRLNSHQTWRAKNILQHYLQQSRFTPLEVTGKHKTDSEPLTNSQ